jgi:hypothetical protein
MVVRRSLPALVLMGVVMVWWIWVVEHALLDGAGTRGWVEAGFADCGRVAGGGMCA